MKAIVIDTETINIRDLDAYEISFAVVNLETFEVEKIVSYLIEEVYCSDLYKKAYYYRANKDKYEKMLENEEITIKAASEVREELNRTLKEDGITYVSAFNIKFDLRSLSYTFIKYAGAKNQITFDRLKRLGFKDKMTSHGFRHTASTILHENIHIHGVQSDVIEMQLAHVEKNSVKGVYNKAMYLPERVRLMEWWSGYLDSLKKPQRPALQ